MSTPIAVFPGAVATDGQLKVANNLIQTTLRVSCSTTDTVLFVNSVAGFVGNGLISIEKEILAIDSVQTVNNTLTVNVVGRGFDGTAAAAHAAGATVSMFIDAWHHNAAAAEIKAIEAFLGPNGQNLTQGAGFIIANNYVFTQTPGGSLIAGNNTITLTPVPLGVNGSDLHHYLYISGGTGTPEAVPITGGTAVSGAPSGTVIVGCANTHSGAWTIQSATVGMQEAFNANSAAPCLVLVLAGTYTLYGPVYMPWLATQTVATPFTLQGWGNVLFNVATTFPLTVKGVFIGYDGGEVWGATYRGFTVSFTQPDSTNLALYTHWPPAFYLRGNLGSTLEDIQIWTAWLGIDMVSPYCGGTEIRRLLVSAFGGCIDIDGAADTIIIEDVHAWPYNCTANQQTAFWSAAGPFFIRCGRIDDFKFVNLLSEAGGGLIFRKGVDGNVSGGFCNNLILDVWGGLQMSAGNVSISGLSGGPNAQSNLISMTGGQLLITNMRVQNPPNQTVPVVSVNWSNSAGNNILSITNSWLQLFGAQISMLTATSVSGSGGMVQLIGNRMDRQTGVAYTQPQIWIKDNGTRAIIMANTLTDVGSGSGVFLNIAVDNWHILGPNTAPGWTVTLPAQPLTSYVQADSLFSFPQAPGTFWGPVSLIGYASAPPGSLTLANGLNSNIALDANRENFWIILGSPTAAFSVGGFTNGVSGRWLWLYNNTGQQMTIVNNDASSVVANRITTLTGSNVVLRAGNSFASFIYWGTTGWILMSTN